MKIYTPKPVDLIRLQIRSKDQETKYITFCETDLNTCIKNITHFINIECRRKKVSVFNSVNKTSLDFRNCLGGKNGKSKSVSFQGLTTQETHDLIIKIFS